ncbi:hypothetical protein BD414DRAFT_408474 [Trametes punicea]|nr:hypothetical protein BD414DRAFT_408474 [Trametes punicea]
MAALQHQAVASSSLTGGEGRPSLPGGLSREDMLNMAPVPRSLVLNTNLSQRLEEELKHTLLEISEHYCGGDRHSGEEDAETEDCLQEAFQLPETIRQRKQTLANQKAALQECRAQVLRLIEDINEIHLGLEAQLITALENLPPHLRAERIAQADVLAATIETALLKLSLIRARAHRALYGFALPPPPPPRKPSASRRPRSPDEPDPGEQSDTPRTVAQAVAAAHDALLARQRAQDAEMRELDGQLTAYEGVLRLVDGSAAAARGKGAFAQVVSDMARVKRETEECRRDLRRLGWTGD